jgi:hypothetical protein
MVLEALGVVKALEKGVGLMAGATAGWKALATATVTVSRTGLAVVAIWMTRICAVAIATIQMRMGQVARKRVRVAPQMRMG